MDVSVGQFVKACKKDLRITRVIFKENPDLINCYWDDEPLLFKFLFYNNCRNLRSARFLLKIGFNPNILNVFYQTPLFCAAISNNIKVGKLLLEYGADMYLEGIDEGLLDRTLCPYFVAAKYLNIEFMKLLVENGFNPAHQDSNGQFAFHFIPKNLKYEKVDNIFCFLKNIKWPEKIMPCIGVKTPKIDEDCLRIYQLWLACIDHNFSVAKELIINKPKLIDTVQYSYPFYSLFIREFVIWEDIEVVDFLIKNGFSVNSFDKSGESILATAIRTNSNISVDFLINNGSDLYLESKELVGERVSEKCFLCPFFVAVYYSNIEAIKLIIKDGFDPMYKDSHNKTAYDYLPEKSQDESSENTRNNVLTLLANYKK